MLTNTRQGTRRAEGQEGRKQGWHPILAPKAEVGKLLVKEGREGRRDVGDEK